MHYSLQRHPVPVRAWFRHSLVLTFAFPEQLLAPLLPPGLVLDSYKGHGFLAVAMVQTHDLRPTFLPKLFGQDFFLTGYRIFTRHQTPEGRWLRGLRILRSDTDSKLMVWGGNLLTHYQYQHANIRFEETEGRLGIQIETPSGLADVNVIARTDRATDHPPPDSPFENLHQARLFAGPLPFTFDYEPQTHSLIIIEGVRQNWKPTPVDVEISRLTFLDQPPFNKVKPVLANAFHVTDIPYKWKRGVLEPLPEQA